MVYVTVKYCMQVGGSDQMCSEDERESDHKHKGTGKMAEWVEGVVFHCFMQTSRIVASVTQAP